MKSFLKQTNKTAYLLYIPALLIMSAMALLAFHDVQTAQGVGLYYAYKTGYANRLPFDLLVDCIGGFFIITLILIPVILLKKGKIDSVFRFSLLFFAMAPFINPASIVHIISNLSNLSIRTSLVDGNFGAGLTEGLFDPLAYLWLELPLFVLTLMMNKQNKNYVLKTWKKIFLVFAFICLICFVLFPSIAEYTLFLMNYAVLIVIFDEAELLVENCLSKNTRCTKYISLLIYGILGLRSIYRMVDLMQHTHM